jgi:hypothetical protein
MPRLFFVVFCTLALCPLVEAQPSPARRAFSGRVTTDNGLPVGGAAVTMRRLVAGSAAFWGTVLYSDARGDFSFSDAEDGEYAVTIEAGGLTRWNSNFILNEKTTSFKASLDRLATISLRVLRLDGTPLTNTPVSILARETTHGESTTRRVATDAQGVLSFGDATPGVVSLRVVAPGVGYADLNDLKIAPASITATTDTRLQAGATLRISVREAAVANDAAKAAASRVLGGVTVTILLAPTDASRFQSMGLSGIYDNGNGSLVTRDGEDTTEVSALAPGSYSVSIARTNYSGSTATQNVEIKATETATLAFDLKRGDGVSVGSIVLAAQNAKGQALGNRDLFIPMEMLAPTADNIIGYAWRSARTDAAGRVVLYPVDTGRWRLTPRIAANSNTPANQASPAAAPQITTVAALAASTDPAALTFSFPVD